ncbi:MT0933-like antitoxin protein [Micromonospora rhizosphaerae]|uniref:MT0933-like antitoxin protein n=1 Tax=Micromonospora rhizosphaerae TaxID=568872 RepID=A0A1C6RLK1_9ACTN|nr:antitoxin [Micromonospora rhizosphaerae]SCL17988.1 MT0933-like antitoxin protein [Micromonospora rhizosphaerae]
MRDFMNKAKGFADRYEKQVDQAMDKAGETANRRTGGKYEEQIKKGVETAKQRTGEGGQKR